MYEEGTVRLTALAKEVNCLEVVLLEGRERDWEIFSNTEDALKFVAEQEKLGVATKHTKIITNASIADMSCA